MKLRKWSLLALAVAGVLPAPAAELSPRSDRAAWRDAASFLDLSTTQMAAMRAAHAEYTRELQELSGQAQALGARKAAVPSVTDAANPALCQRSQALNAAYRTKVRAPLSDAQLKRLAQLEQAMELLPYIESAQAAGLIADRIKLPVVGLPLGTVEADYIWRRQAATPLPGCPASVVHREVESEDGSKTQPKLKK